MILILASTEDPHADRVERALDRHCVRHERAHLSDFPVNARWSQSFGPDGTKSGAICAGGRRIDLAEVSAVWNRRPGFPRLHPGMDAADEAFARDEARKFVDGVWASLRAVRWVNPVFEARRAEAKAAQLAAAAGVGLRTPRTLMTNDADLALEFVRGCGERAIYKTFGQFDRSAVCEGDHRGVMANIVGAGAVEERAGQIAVAPCIFQEYIEKAFEVRATLLPGACFAAAIFSQGSERSRVDWRRLDLENTPYTAYALPSEVEEKLHSLLGRMGLVFGCCDLVVTPSGEHVFLEVNQAGQWGWVEELTGLRITERFALQLADWDREHAN